MNETDDSKDASCLSKQPDGMGLFYGHYRGSRIDVMPPCEWDAIEWRAFVNGDEIGSVYDSCEKAEAAAKNIIDRWELERGKDAD